MTDSSTAASRDRQILGMSYKFQRLREKIRQAVASGELNGKLPGERELARRFHVNAKTLSKALTDLAAEGLLHRSIGRGTFVKGAETAQVSTPERWLLLVDSMVNEKFIESLKELHPEVEISDNLAALRPSYLSQFAAVVDMTQEVPEAFVRDLLIRNIPVVAVGKEPHKYSVNAVLLDATLGACQLTRDLALAGHRRFLAVEGRNHNTIAEAIRRSAMRYCPDYSVDACSPEDVLCAMEFGATACICDSGRSASRTMEVLNSAGVSIPERMSVAAVGWTDNDYPCTGYYADARDKAVAVADILRRGQPGRPTTIWLNGVRVDRATTGQPAENVAATLSAASRADVIVA